MSIYSRADLTGRKALVTGGSMGIGKELAKVLAIAGADVIISCRNKERGMDTVNQMQKEVKGSLHVIACDHQYWKDSPSFVGSVLSHLEGLDILVNNVGTGAVQSIEKFEDETLERVIALNLSTPFALIRGFSSALRRSKAGRIINISSVLGVTGRKHRSVYSASKGGMISMTRSLAVEFAANKVTVNAIAPGQFLTPLTDNMWKDPGRRDPVTALIPMERWGNTSELGGLALVLASNLGSFITGQVLTVDGGWSIC